MASERSVEDSVRALRSDYEAVFGTEAGKRVLADLFLRFGGAPWYASPPEQHLLAWMGGERNVVNYMLDALGRRSDPSRWNETADDAADRASGR